MNHRLVDHEIIIFKRVEKTEALYILNILSSRCFRNNWKTLVFSIFPFLKQSRFNLCRFAPCPAIFAAYKNVGQSPVIFLIGCRYIVV